ncbi:MAG: NAD(P)(+) transhydrogenase (Re/Si-specific) subunit beta [Opitutales bacterium]
MNSDFIYIVSAILLIWGIKLLGKTASARKGNFISAAGMFLAILVTLLRFPPQNLTVTFAVAFAGAYVGLLMAIRVQMTAMPEMVALFNGFGGLASVAVGIVEGIKLNYIPQFYYDFQLYFAQVATCLTIIIGAITFTGSLIAYGKLSQKMPTGSICFCGQKWVDAFLVVLLVVASCEWIYAHNVWAFYTLIALSTIGGGLFVLHIGGGDMPVIISLLNSLSGIAAGAAGLILLNKVLIVAGCLVGTSGLILTLIMCKAMNRSVQKVLLGGFAQKQTKKQAGTQLEPKTISVEDAYYILEAARTVAIVPGYGLAVAQAQHAVKDLAQRFMQNGADVFYAIHPVAGRMPGHMNVLLAEADVDYDQLTELETANTRFADTDVAIVVGANDVVNPAAVENPDSPLYGMPILEVFNARTVFVLKRGQGKGFSGLENELFTKDNTRMIYGDAKSTLTQLAAEFKNAE